MHHDESEELDEVVYRQVRVPQNGAQQRFFDGPSGMDRHDSSRPCSRMNQDQMAPLLPILNETGLSKRSNHLPSMTEGILAMNQAGIVTLP
jgi:hypothetical protein